MSRKHVWDAISGSNLSLLGQQRHAAVLTPQIYLLDPRQGLLKQLWLVRQTRFVVERREIRDLLDEVRCAIPFFVLKRLLSVRLEWRG